MVAVSIKPSCRNNCAYMYTMMLDYIREHCKMYKFPLKASVQFPHLTAISILNIGLICFLQCCLISILD